MTETRTPAEWPTVPSPASHSEAQPSSPSSKHCGSANWWPFMVVGIGAVMILNQFGIHAWGFLWPAFAIAWGLSHLIGGRGRRTHRTHGPHRTRRVSGGGELGSDD